jgi:hypothetical protein
VLLLAFFSSVAVQGSLSLSARTVDENGSAIGNGYCPIVVDSNNTVHIAYTAWSGDEDKFPHYFVMYASWNGTGFNTQKVSEGFAYSLVLDADGNPHILYGANGLTYASWTGTGWVSQLVDINAGGFGMVALDSHGSPHIAYKGDSNTVKYSSWTGTSWNIQTVDTLLDPSQEVPFKLSFVLDKNNTPYIMYSPSSYADYSQAVGIMAKNITLAIWQNSNWKIQPLFLPSPTGDYGDLVLDSKGDLHSVFTQHYLDSENNIRGTMLYSTWNGAAWDMQTVFSNISLPYSMSLLLDSNDYPHIVTSTGINALWKGTTWDIQTINLTRTYGPISLAIDSNSNPHISYRQQSPSQVIANIIYTTANWAYSPSQTISLTLAIQVFTILVPVLIIIAVVVMVTYVWRGTRNFKSIKCLSAFMEA